MLRKRGVATSKRASFVVAIGLGVALLLTVTPRNAVALTLADLVGGSSFTTGDKLEFSGFDASFAGAIVSDPSLFKVDVLFDGFRVETPILVADGEVGSLLLNYAVAVIGGSAGVDGAQVALDGDAAGLGAATSVTDTLRDPLTDDVLGSLIAYSTGGGTHQPTDALAFGPLPSLHVTNSLQADSMLFQPGVVGGVATIAQITQRFSAAPVPEPGTLLLLSAALVGIGVVGRPRRRWSSLGNGSERRT